MEDEDAAAMVIVIQVMDLVIPLLGMEDVFRLSMVCKDLQRATQSPWLWKEVMSQSFQMPQPLIWKYNLPYLSSSRKVAPVVEVSFNRDIPMSDDSTFSVHR